MSKRKGTRNEHRSIALLEASGYRGIELAAFVDQAYKSGLAKLAIEAGMASGLHQVAAVADASRT